MHHASALAESGAKDPIRILEHAVLEADHDELAALEARFDQAANVLCMREVQRRVNFVENVHGRRLELKEREDEGKSD